MTEADNYNIITDPALVKNRIFVGNLPVCTREELASIFLPYGEVLGSVVQKNYGFVQLESEEVANKCAMSLNKSTFKTKILRVRNANNRAPKGANANENAKNLQMPQVPVTVQGGIVMSAAAAAAGEPVINDCEIIVVNRDNTKYAEYIEHRLRNMGMRVDVLFPNEDVMLGKVLANISSRGCLYAVLVTPQHESLSSITVNILYGVPAEHRNMPLEDAVNLIATDFRLKGQREAVNNSAGPASMPQPQRRHPDQMQQLIDMLADNRPMTALQYECIIKYLQGEREDQLKREVGEANAAAKLLDPDPEIELQKKILSIMNKPAVTETGIELMYPNLEAVRDDKRLMELLRDERVIAAMETIFNSDTLFDAVAELL
ncbi:nuclear receptor coactivator 5-like [Drosophila miranda]|uniref:nuclear receptor coactivator 5-like n=1 Tax=Drosophila miranda TaxID=7229 RepID=UPI00143F6F0A|nr:nuclear receptor coactivator 5-like [Drosophila miranda]